jgi:hypothetical protein
MTGWRQERMRIMTYSIVLTSYCARCIVNANSQVVS